MGRGSGRGQELGLFCEEGPSRAIISMGPGLGGDVEVKRQSQKAESSHIMSSIVRPIRTWGEGESDAFRRFPNFG